MNARWPKQVRPLAWLLERFWQPLREVHDNEARWEESDLAQLKARPFTVIATGTRFVHEPTRGIIYYTDGQLDESIARPVRERLSAISRDKGLPIVTAALRHR